MSLSQRCRQGYGEDWLRAVIRVGVIAFVVFEILGMTMISLSTARGAEPEVNAQGPDGSTALLWAAHHGDGAEVKRLIAAGADVAKGNRYGATPMSEAAMQGETEVLAALLAGGADVSSPSKEGQTTLMLVARTGNVEAARLLLAHGAQVDAREQFAGQTALIWATAEGQPQMVKLLLEHHANPNARSVVRDWQRKVTAEGRPKDMHRGGLTPLLYAARESCIECARLLLAAGADINLPDPDGRTALLLALMNYHWDFAKFLIERGADVNAWDFWGESPLFEAVDLKAPIHSGRVDLPGIEAATGADIVELLLKKGADPNIQLKLRPPYRQAVADRIQAPVFTTGATPLIRAARGADLPTIRLLLKYGAQVDLPNINGVTPLLAVAGATRGLVTVDDHVVTEQETLETVRLLKEAGADVNVATHDGSPLPGGAPSQAGETALHAAAMRGWDDLVKLLVSYGAKLDAEAVHASLTPIDFAMGRFQPGFLETKPVPHPATAALLKELGAREEHPGLPPWPGIPTPTIIANVPN